MISINLENTPKTQKIYTRVVNYYISNIGVEIQPVMSFGKGYSNLDLEKC